MTSSTPPTPDISTWDQTGHFRFVLTWPPPPRAALFPIPTFFSGAHIRGGQEPIYGADKAVVKKILGLGRRGATPRDRRRRGLSTPGPGPREAGCEGGVSGKRWGSEGGGRG